VDGLEGVVDACPRCTLLHEIWETSLRLNSLIRRFNPGHDDVKKLKPPQPLHDPRQLSLIAD